MTDFETSLDKPEDALSFEEALSQLEAIVERLESGTVDLDKALEVIEKGMDVPKEARPESPGGTGDPVIYEDES